MKIISKFSDYYDSAQVYGIDPLLTWVRNTDSVLLDKNNPEFKELHKDFHDSWMFYTYIWRTLLPCHPVDVKLYIVGYCGKSFILLTVPKDKRIVGRHTRNIPVVDNIFTLYDIEDLKKLVFTSNATKSKLKAKKNTFKSIQEFYNKYHNSDRLAYVFERYKCPLFVICREGVSTKYRLTTNPKLKELYFTKNPLINTNAPNVYQDISSYMSGVLGLNDKDIIEIDDKHRLTSKGLGKDSFVRDKHPSKPRRGGKSGNSSVGRA